MKNVFLLGLIVFFGACKPIIKEDIAPNNPKSVSKNERRMYNDAELAELIAKFNAVPVPPKEGEKKLESSQGYTYCNGECAAIVNTYSHNLFGTTLWYSYEVIQVPQADGSDCPCGPFTL